MQNSIPDLTFVIPIRIESEERLKNVLTLLKFLNKIFHSKIIIYEGDTQQRFYPPLAINNLTYKFYYDNGTVFNRTLYRNKLLSSAITPYVAICDTDAIVPPFQIVGALRQLREKEVVMAFPYDGRFFMADRKTSDLFRKYLDLDILFANKNYMRLMHGFNSCGGMFIVNKEEYLNVGGENENFSGWDAEDDERVKRLEILGLQVGFVNGCIYHLWHPKLPGSKFASDQIEASNLRELLRICASEKKELALEFGTVKKESK